MINIEGSQSTQLTMSNGVAGDWEATLNGKKLYTLPARFTVQDTFLIKDTINAMMAEAADHARADAKALHDVTMNRIVTNGDMQLTMLKEENIRLANALERMYLEEDDAK